MPLDVSTAFTPLASLLGGVSIGLAAVMVMGLFGGIAGIAGITRGAWPGIREDWPWRLAFLAGLVLAPLGWQLAAGGPVQQTVPSDPLAMGLAGLLVGFGTTWGSGCTSGHGVCGLARQSPRSAAAVAAFFASAVVTVFVLRHAAG